MIAVDYRRAIVVADNSREIVDFVRKSHVLQTASRIYYFFKFFLI
jgi:hypothetical protein